MSIDSEINTDKAILTPTNKEADMLNQKVLDMFPGHSLNLLSADSVVMSESENEIANFPPELLNTLNPNNFPPHELNLKIGCTVILLRNLNTHEGLCNGTRLKVINISGNQKILEVQILTGPNKNDIVYLPRIDLLTNKEEYTVILKRRQFPLKLAYAITINKAQGQSLKRVGIYLKEPVFAHGQLYVAMSRSGDGNETKLFIENISSVQGNFPGKLGTYTSNIVYQEALL
jgi:hypothetical protein